MRDLGTLEINRTSPGPYSCGKAIIKNAHMHYTTTGWAWVAECQRVGAARKITLKTQSYKLN